MAEKLTIDNLLPHLPANAKQLQQRFPAFPMDLLTRLLKAGENVGVCQWDALSNRWVLRPATEGKARKCMVCGDKYVPTSNAQKHCDRHAERRWKDPTAPAPEPPKPVTTKPRQCAKCGAEFVPSGNRQKFCPEHAWRKSGKSGEPATKSGEQLPDNQPEVPALPDQVTEVPILFPIESNTQPAPSVSFAGFPSLEVAPRRGLLCRVVEGEYVIERPGGLALSFTAEEVGLLFGWLGACINHTGA